MKIPNINLFEEELVKMMREFWAIDNNDECAKQTLDFMDKYEIFEEEGIRNQLSKEIGGIEE